MPEIRVDPLSGDHAIIAPDRAGRPGKNWSFPLAKHDPLEKECPFCPGNEEMTPPESYIQAADGQESNGAYWLIRSFPNKFPSLSMDALVDNPTASSRSAEPAQGVHEVLVHSPWHNRSLADLDERQMVYLMSALQSRARSLLENDRINDVCVITNHRRESGASLAHPHSQLFALSRPSPQKQKELRSFGGYARENLGCLLCAHLAEEEDFGERLVFADSDFLLLSKWAARFPFEMILIPRAHRGHPESDSDALVASRGIGLAVRLIRQVLGDAPYNLALKIAPKEDKDGYHWHWEISPRLTVIAGFELASGIFINPVSPEQAGERLRQALKKPPF